MKEVTHMGGVKMTVEEMLDKLKENTDPRFDPFLAFLIQEKISKKLSAHDMKKIFTYFKENWKQIGG